MGVKLAYDILSILVPVLVAMAVEYIRRRLGYEKMKKIQEEIITKQNLAVLAVRFVEQAYRNFTLKINTSRQLNGWQAGPGS